MTEAIILIICIWSFIAFGFWLILNRFNDSFDVVGALGVCFFLLIVLLVTTGIIWTSAKDTDYHDVLKENHMLKEQIKSMEYHGFVQPEKKDDFK